MKPSRVPYIALFFWEIKMFRFSPIEFKVLESSSPGQISWRFVGTSR